MKVKMVVQTLMRFQRGRFPPLLMARMLETLTQRRRPEGFCHGHYINSCRRNAQVFALGLVNINLPTSLIYPVIYINPIILHHKSIYP